MDYKKAASYWENKDAESKAMDSEELKAEIEKFVSARNTCALATACGEFVRCTPIEYSYMDGKFWMLSEGGLKFGALEKNRNVCLAIFDGYSGFSSIAGAQVTGTAEIVEPWTEEYRALLKFKGIPEESLRALQNEMYLIKITPKRVDFLSSRLKARGFGARQHVVF